MRQDTKISESPKYFPITLCVNIINVKLPEYRIFRILGKWNKFTINIFTYLVKENQFSECKWLTCIF